MEVGCSANSSVCKDVRGTITQCSDYEAKDGSHEPTRAEQRRMQRLAYILDERELLGDGANPNYLKYVPPEIAMKDDL